MTIRDALNEGQSSLSGCETETPRLDAALLLAHVLGISREKLYMELPEKVDEADCLSYHSLLEKRRDGEPVAWIIGFKEFWGYRYRVGPGVLCPRPDSEIMVETALEIMGERNSGRLHDCCTGPGTLALALAAERPEWLVSASDISPDVEKYFRENNRRIAGGRVTFQFSDLLSDIEEAWDVIVSNPPYLTPNETSERTALGWREPVLALDGGGKDGLNIIRRLIPQAAERLRSGGSLLLEADPLQMTGIRKILADNGFSSVEVRKDLGNRDRVIYGRYLENR